MVGVMLLSRHYAASAPWAQATSAKPTATGPRRVQHGRALLLTSGGGAANDSEVALCTSLHRLGLQVEQAPSASGAGALLRQAEHQGQAYDLLLVRPQHGGLCGMNLAAALCLPLRRRPVTALCVGRENRESLHGHGQATADVLLEDGAELFEIAESLLPHLAPKS